MAKSKLSQKDELFHDFALNGDMWKVVMRVGMPLAVYQTLLLIFKFLDSMIASHISSSSVSAVTYLGQINNLFSAIGAGLAVGGSLEISKAYGAGDFEMVKKRVNSLFALTVALCIFIILIIPFTPMLLTLAKTPKELIDIGSKYFATELFTLSLTFLNGVFFAIERVRGNSKRILFLNFACLIFKLGLTAIFIYGFSGNIQSIAIANTITQLIILICAIYFMTTTDSIFRLVFKYISFKKPVIIPMLSLAYPVMLEKASFSFGKVIVNSISGMYGPLAVGALGISNSIGSITTSPQMGFQEGTAAIISQNIGAGNKKRAIDAFWKTLIINALIGLVGLVLTLAFINQIAYIFSNSTAGYDKEFHKMIVNMYKYEAWGGNFFLGINSAIVAMLLGFGYTKLTLLINFCRVLVFRVPVLWFLQAYTNRGAESPGIAMMLSNIFTTILSTYIAFLVLKKIKTTY